MNIIAIDPGNLKSAFVIWDGEMPIILFGKVPNAELKDLLIEWHWGPRCLEYEVVIEKIACMGMAVGEDVFETVFWSGRFAETLYYNETPWHRMKRHEVKMHLCGSTRAKDSNIITAIVDRFDPERLFGKYGKGKKDNNGPFFGFSKDVWQAMGLAVTWFDQNQTN